MKLGNPKTNADVQMSEAFVTSVFLALSGGFQDAYTYFTREEVFSNAPLFWKSVPSFPPRILYAPETAAY